MSPGSFDAARVKAEYDEFYRHTDFVRFPRSERAFIRSLARRYRIAAGQRVIDLGCGTGKYARLFTDIGCDVTAVDLSEAAVERVQQVAPAAHALVGDLRHVPCADSSFDVVFASGVSLFNSSDLVGLTPLVHHFSALLKPGGTLVFVKTSSLTNRASKRNSRIDYSVQAYESVFRCDASLELIGSHTVFPQAFALLGIAAFSRRVSSLASVVTRAVGLPLRVYLVYRKREQCLGSRAVRTA